MALHVPLWVFFIMSRCSDDEELHCGSIVTHIWIHSVLSTEVLRPRRSLIIHLHSKGERMEVEFSFNCILRFSCMNWEKILILNWNWNCEIEPFSAEGIQAMTGSLRGLSLTATPTVSSERSRKIVPSRYVCNRFSKRFESMRIRGYPYARYGILRRNWYLRMWRLCACGTKLRSYSFGLLCSVMWRSYS